MVAGATGSMGASTSSKRWTSAAVHCVYARPGRPAALALYRHAVHATGWVWRKDVRPRPPYLAGSVATRHCKLGRKGGLLRELCKSACLSTVNALKVWCESLQRVGTHEVHELRCGIAAECLEGNLRCCS
eukprot:3828525-Amphidinium_carterae.4